MGIDKEAKVLLTGGMIIKKEDIIATGFLKSANLTTVNNYGAVNNYNAVNNYGAFSSTPQIPNMEINIQVEQYILNFNNNLYRRVAVVYLDD